MIAVPAASAGVHKYNTKLSFTWDAPHDGTALFHGGAGGVQSKVRKCERGRRVVLFQRQPGADRKFATAESFFQPSSRAWRLGSEAPQRHASPGDRLYAEVKRKVRNDGDVCRRPLGDQDVPDITG